MKKIIIILLSISMLLIPRGRVTAQFPIDRYLHGKPGIWTKPIPAPLTGEVVESTSRTVDEAIDTPIVEPVATEVPTAVPTDVPTEVTTTPSDPNYVPTLEEFSTQVRNAGYLGIWAEGAFAFEVIGMSWGQVPGTRNGARIWQPVPNSPPSTSSTRTTVCLLQSRPVTARATKPACSS